MESDETARAEELLRRLKREKNGVVVDAMTARGIHYPVNYGVSVPAIKHAAKACAPSHAFAALLFDRPERELKLAAVWIDRPEWVTAQQMEAWGAKLDNSEIAEQVAFLFAQTSDAVPQAMRWLAADGPWLIYAALLMSARALQLPDRVTGGQAVQIAQAVDALVRRVELPAYALRAAAAALARIFARGNAAARNVRSLCDAYAGAGERQLQALAEELTWQIES